MRAVLEACNRVFRVSIYFLDFYFDGTVFHDYGVVDATVQRRRMRVDTGAFGPRQSSFLGAPDTIFLV